MVNREHAKTNDLNEIKRGRQRWVEGKCTIVRIRWRENESEMRNREGHGEGMDWAGGRS